MTQKSTTTKAPDPSLLFETLNAYQRTEALRGAIELDLFSAIGSGSATARELTKKVPADERALRILADYLCIIGFLEKDGDAYRLTPDSRLFLDKSSPVYLGGSVEFLSSDTMRSAFEDVAGTVRKGRTQLPDKGTVSEDNPVWVRFARGMGPMMRIPADAVAEHLGVPRNKPFHVLDVAAGHGEFGFAFAKRSPQCIVHAADWKQVLDYTAEKAAEYGLSEQLRCVPGDAFSVDLPSAMDLVLIPNFLHHFDKADCVRFLKRVRESLRDGGEVCIIEFVPNDDRITPPGSAGFSFIMLCTTPKGDAYTFKEYEAMLSEAGFREAALGKLDIGMQAVVRAKK